MNNSESLLVQPLIQRLSGLPLNLIMEKLSFIDLTSFASAINLDFPFLMVPSGEKDDHYPGLTIWNIFNNKTYKLEIPEISNRYINGCSVDGWVINRHKYLHDIDQLLHPITRKVVELPRSRYLYCDKLITSSSSLPSSEDFIAMAISDSNSNLSYCRPGRKNDPWIQVACSSINRFRDLTYYKGKFYALKYHGEVVVVEGLLDGDLPTTTLFTPSNGTCFSCKSCFVKSSCDLFKILEWKDGFKIFKLDFNGRKWEEVKNLGDCSFFVGCVGNSFSLTVTDFLGCEANCIYYILDGGDFGTYHGGYGVFNLMDGTTKLFPSPMDDLLQQPIWYVLRSKLMEVK